MTRRPGAAPRVAAPGAALDLPRRRGVEGRMRAILPSCLVLAFTR
ncbi:hypothetical protein [Falsiroseomonas sp. HW251]